MEQARFYFLAGLTLLIVAIIGGVLMTLSGMDPTMATSILGVVMSFASLMVFQYRNASEVKSHADSVRRELRTSNAIREIQLEDIRSVGEATHDLITSDYLATLKSLALSQRQLAMRTGKPEDLRAAEDAEENARQYEERQKGGVDPLPSPVSHPESKSDENPNPGESK